MVIDAILVARLARELDERLRGARLTDAGLTDDGRPALVFAGQALPLVLDAFASPPAVLFDEAPISIAGDPGYLRAVATSLRGMRLAAVRPVPGERIVTFDFAARSRFGVVDGYRLVVELIPRFGNVLLLKGETIVAAAKQFGPAENARRTILIGGRYAPPPPRPPGSRPTGGEPPPDEGSLLDLLRDSARDRRAREEHGAVARRGAALRKRIERRLAALRDERARLIARRDDAASRDRLRRWGEALYAFAHLVPARATRFSPPTDPQLEIELDPELDAKGNAAAMFARYRKLVDGLPHLERRLTHVESSLGELEEFEWQLDGADAATVREIASALGETGGAAAAPGKEKKRRRAPLHYALPSEARIYVGRSPQENAEVTFRLARPDDLWFHVREQPGAHVVLQSAPGREPSPDDLAAAAGAAAFYSKARTSDRVAVDYVARKHVRKQRDAAPGRVWYTNARTLVVRPLDPASYVGSAS